MARKLPEKIRRALMTIVMVGIAGSGIVDSVALEPGWKTIKDQTIGCIDREELKQILSIGSSGDKEAFKKALMRSLASDRCVVFRQGEEVHLEEVSMFAGVAKVRARGNPAGYWIDYGYLSLN